MAAAFPFTSPSAAGTECSSFSSSSATTPTLTNGGSGGVGGGVGGWSGSRREDYHPFTANLGASTMIGNMVSATDSSTSLSSSAVSMACDKCRQTPDSLSELLTLPCLHTLCRKCFQAQGNFHVPTSHKPPVCPVCGSGDAGSLMADEQRNLATASASTSASFFQDFPSVFSSSGAVHRQEQTFSSPSPSGDVSSYSNFSAAGSRTTPSSSSYLFNEQLNVDTSLLIGSLLDSVSMHDDVLQFLPKGLQAASQRRPSATSTSGKLSTTSTSLVNSPFGFRVLGSANTASSGTISPAPFQQLPPSRGVQQQQQQPVFSLAVGGHRSAGVPFTLSQQQQQPGILPMAKMTPTSSSSTSSFTSAPACSICADGAEAACRCEDCAEYLCAKCVQAHLRVRLTRDHRMIAIFPSPAQQQGQLSATHSPASTASLMSSLWPMSNSPSAAQQQTRVGSNQPASASKQQSPMLGVQRPVANMATRQPAISAGFCAQHQFEPMTFYCETCSESLCRFCTSNNPNHPFPVHRISAIAAKTTASGGGEKTNTRGEAQSLTQLFADAHQCVRVLDEAVRGVDHMTERVETRMHSVANEIRGVIHHHIGALEERKRELLERVDAVRTAKLGALNLQREELRKYLASSKTALEQAEKMLKTSQQQKQRQEDDSETTVRLRSLLHEQLQALKSSRPCLQPQEDDQLSFSAPEPSILKTVRLLGNVITGAYAPNCTLLGDAVRRAIKDKPIYYTVQARDHVGEQLTTGGDQVNAFVVATSGDGNVADVAPQLVDIYDKKNGTYLCRYEPNQEGEHQVHIFVRGCPIRCSPFTLIVRRGRDYTTIGATPMLSFGGEGTGDGQLCRPWGICCDRQGRIIVADRSNSRIQIFDQEGKFLQKFGSPGCRNGQFDRPAGVTVNRKNQIVVVDKDNHRVQVFTSDGQFLFKFGEKGRGNGQFNYPWDVAVSSNDDSVAISDTRNHRVQLFDSRGTFLNKFGFESSLFYKQFDSPRGLVFAPDGRLFCTDFNNHRLAVIDVVHNQMEFFGREGEYDGAFRRPQGLDMDLEGHLIIADSRNNRVQVFTPQLTFLCSFGIEGYPPRGRSVMDRPCDVCVCEGKIFVVDFGNNKIHVY